MPDNVPITAGVGTDIATDQLLTGEHVQLLKLVDGTANSSTRIEAGVLPLGRPDTKRNPASGIPVIVKVDYYPGGAVQQHWITLCGKQDDDYIAADPISGTRILFREKYGDPARYIFRVVTYVRRGL